MIDRITVDKILDAANIVDVVSDFVTLKRAGVNLKGLCPFHDDTTPSFMVSPAKNLCKCFACGEGGSPVHFIMKHEQLSYPDALRYLAKKYGIEIQEKELSKEEMESRNDRDSMFIVNEWARDWFQNELNNTPDGKAIGLAYFRGRGFRDDILKEFQVGYSPNNKEHTLAADAQKAGYQEKFLINTPNEKDTKLSIGTGLCLKNEQDGKLRDRFRGRVIWPIFTMSGRVAGFGGRVLDAATKGVNVKYMNSPESLVYSKRRELFGLYQAKEAIRKQDLCYLVEGYTDVMAMHQMGVENVVASSGTALTNEQIRLIHRMTNNITVIFDGDEAGIHASERGIDMLLAEGMNVKLLLLPDGDDPDSFARKHNATEYQQYLKENQVDFVDYKTSHLMESAKDDPTKLGQLIHNVSESIAVIPDEITRVLYIRQAAQKLHMEERLITEAVQKQILRLKDEKRKEQEREERRRLPQNPDAGPEKTDPTEQDVPVNTEIQIPTITKDNPREYVLMQMIVRHGEKFMCQMKDEEGNYIPLTVIEYIYYSLADDEVKLSNPLYERMLAEGFNHIKEEEFKAEHFFVNHPDADINKLAANLCMDNVPLSKLHAEMPADERLDEIVPNLIASLKLNIVQQELKTIIEKTKKPECRNNKEALRYLMAEFNKKSKRAKELARDCGERVILK